MRPEAKNDILAVQSTNEVGTTLARLTGNTYWVRLSMEILSSETTLHSASHTGFPATRFFYSNLRIQETLTTIRAGIEARKGLVVLSGEAGIGTTTLLQKINADLAPNVHRIVTSDPRLRFTDILRLILRSLNDQTASEDEAEAAMLHRCRLHLRAHLQKQQIVALMIDNAHHLAASTLGRLVQNFIETGAPDCNSHLLQIVLAGRPQLKGNMPQAIRLPVRLQLPIMCELHPLEDFEIPSYIEQGLRANASPMAFFEPGAERQIALYSHGNPRRINAICDRALRLSGVCGSDVTVDLIDCVAKDLDLRVAKLDDNRSTSTNFADPAKTFDPAQFQLGEKDTSEIVGETFLQYNRAYDPNPSHRRSAWARTLVMLTVVLGAAAWMQTEPAKQLADWREKLLGSAPAPKQNGGEITAAAPSKVAPKPGAAFAEPNPDGASSLPRAQTNDASVAAQFGTIGEAPRSPDAEALPPSEAPSTLKSADAKPAQARRPATRHNSFQDRAELEARVTEAIENRAIAGITVSVVEGTAFLDGQVATERQRRAADRAARSVPGVERVRNRIGINFG